jgi:hypothetical protein
MKDTITINAQDTIEEVVKDVTIISAQATVEEVQALSNTDRLRLHLTEGGLAVALLDAWLEGSKAEGQKRMLQVINNFNTKKQTKNDKGTVTEN